jgi:hypothetical protein
MKGFVIFEMVDLASFTDFSCLSLLVLSRSFLSLERNNVLIMIWSQIGIAPPPPTHS